MSTSEPQPQSRSRSRSRSRSQGAQSSPQRPLSARARAERIFDHLFEDPSLCVICFATKRSFYPEFDEAVATHLAGRNGAALEACGHRVDDEGEIMVNKATSDADPNCYQEVVPPLKDKYGQILEKAGPKTICQCGVVDFCLDEDHRSTAQLYEAVENIAEHTTDRDEIDEDAFSLSAAKEVVRQATKCDSLAGHDRRVLVGAIELGLKRASTGSQAPP